MFTDCCSSKVPLNFGLVGLKKRSNLQFQSFNSYVTFIPGIMNFIDDEEQPVFAFKSLFYCKTFECKAYQLDEKKP